MSFFVLFAMSILPGLAICWWIYHQDRYEKEPPSLLIRAFICGCLSTLPAILLQTQMQALENPDSLWDTAVFAFIVVGLTEELSKFLLLRFFIYPKDDFNEPMDGIVYMVMVGMGFATLENLLYVLGTEGNGGGFTTAVGRAFTAVPAHAAFAVIMGSYIGLAKFKPEKRDAYMLVGIFLAVFFHGLYDFFLLQQVYQGLAALAIGSLFWSISASRKLISMGQELSPFKNRFEPAQAVVANEETDLPKPIQTESQGFDENDLI
jgi:RsiW-degrading membrane proteinase PrsW (M82 family)